MKVSPLVEKRRPELTGCSSYYHLSTGGKVVSSLFPVTPFRTCTEATLFDPQRPTPFFHPRHCCRNRTSLKGACPSPFRCLSNRTSRLALSGHRHRQNGSVPDLGPHSLASHPLGPPSRPLSAGCRYGRSRVNGPPQLGPCQKGTSPRRNTHRFSLDAATLGHNGELSSISQGSIAVVVDYTRTSHLGRHHSLWPMKAKGQAILSRKHVSVSKIPVLTHSQQLLLNIVSWHSSVFFRMRVLCLHGVGSSGSICQSQFEPFVKAADPSYEFVFVDGPAASIRGPGT